MIATMEAAPAAAMNISPDDRAYVNLAARVESWDELIALGIQTGAGFFQHHVRAKGQRKPRPCSLRLPGPDSGLTPLAVELVRRTYDYALESVFPVEQYAGPVPNVTPGDVFATAGQLLDERKATPIAMLRATRQALGFLGID